MTEESSGSRHDGDHHVTVGGNTIVSTTWSSAITGGASDVLPSVVSTTSKVVREDDHGRATEPFLLPTLKYGYATTRMSWEELRTAVGVSDNDGQPDYDRLRRHVRQQLPYERFKRQLATEWQSLADYVRHTKFAWPQRRHPDTGLFYAVAVETTTVDYEEEMAVPPGPSVLPMTPPQPPTRHLVLAYNDFPYYLALDIVHLVLWKLGGGPIADDEIAQAQRDIVAGKWPPRSSAHAHVEEEDLSRSNHSPEPYETTIAATPSTMSSPPWVVTDMLHWRNPPRLQSLPEIDHVHIVVRVKPSS